MLLLLALLLAVPLRAGEVTPSVLSFISGDKEVLKLTPADLAKRPAARTIEIEDPFYKRRMRYKAVPLKDLLTAAYGGSWGENVLGEVFFEALDGYRSHARVSVLLNDGGMIAFADADAPAWRMMPKGVLPGPFYLVWTGPEQTPAKGFPWPWRITSVKMTVLEDEYPQALPKGAAPDAAAVRGWKIFRRDCISCHAMSGAGGTVGPDLNEPRGITRYQKKSFLKAFIKKPSAFRRTKMPDFDELSNKELADLMAYFDHMTALAGTK
ncbi:MAG: cytochrome c [Elusimicrobiota bacterium]|nr:cytochrome c [Elusimicrobiota bacterium]